MTTWYTDGTVNVTNGSAVVTGAGTLFVANVKVGDEFRLLGGDGYEVAQIDSNTQLTLARPFVGTSQTGQGYEVRPTRGILQETYAKMDALIATFTGYLNTALAGKFASGTTGAPGISHPADTNTGFRLPGSDTIEAITNGVRRWLLTTTTFQLDVLMTGNAVQSAANDATAGRLQKVGAFGVGGAAISYSGDVDDPTLPGGLYFAESASTGTKPHSYGHLIVSRRTSGDRSYQTWVSDAGIAWERCYVSGNWTSWRRRFTYADIVGSVSQSGGVPTGKIIESGSNANGFYVKLADGTLRCERPSLQASASAGMTWTFPVAFASTPAVSATPLATSPHTASVSGVSNTELVFHAFDTNGARSNPYVSLTAEGRWF